MPDIRSICAIGLRGQMGLNGVLPREENTEPETPRTHNGGGV